MKKISHPMGRWPRRREFLAGALLLLITLLAARLRMAQAGESLWLDELHTAWSVAAGPGQVGWRAAMGNQSPLYFYGVWAVTALFGPSEWAFRSLSLLAGIALIPCLYFVVFRWTGCRGAALLAALLAALDRDGVFYAQEARPYAWVQLFGLLHLVIFQRRLSDARLRWRLAWVGAGAILFYLHYTAILLAAAEMAYCAAVWRTPWKPPSRLGPLLADLAVMAMLLLPAAPHLAEIAARRANWRLFVTARPSPAFCNAAWVYLVLPLVASLAFLLLRWIRRKKPWAAAVNARIVLLTGCWLAVPVGLAWAATGLGLAPLFFPRYVIVSALALPVTASLFFLSRPARWERVVLAALVVAASLGTGGMLAQYRRDGRLLADRNEHWREAAACINGQRDGRWPVLVRSGLIEADALEEPHTEAFRQYCLLPVLTIYRVDRPVAEMIPLPTTRPPKLSPQDRRRILARRGAWLLVRGDANTADAVARSVLAQLRAADAAAQIDARRSFGSVIVLRIAVTGRAAGSP